MTSKEQKEKSVDIIIRGTTNDVRLLRRIFKSYLPNAKRSEKSHIECYLELINNALKKATVELANGSIE